MKDYLIAGGGICGIASALGIARAGGSARVFEQANAFEEAGAGLQMSPNAVRALQYLGAWEAMEPMCYAPAHIHIRDGITGRTLKRVPLGSAFERRFGSPYRVAHRADLLRALLEVARQTSGISLEGGKQVVAAKGAIGEASLVFEDGQREHGKAVIACDGIRSKLRLSAYPGTAPRNSGLTLWRALVPAGMAYRGIDRDDVSLWLRPGGHTVHYAVSGGRSVSIVHVCPTEEPPAAGGPPIHGLTEELWHLLSSPENWTAWPGLDLDPLHDWTQAWGVMLGDAAHATLPFLAQGAAMALEDACALSKQIAADAPLGGIAGERRRRTARVQLDSRRQGRIYHAGGVLRQARNLMMSAMSDDSFIGRLAWLYGWRP